LTFFEVEMMMNLCGGDIIICNNPYYTFRQKYNIKKKFRMHTEMFFTNIINNKNPASFPKRDFIYKKS